MARTRYNPMATSPAPRWLKTYDYLGNVLSCRRIEPYADLLPVIEAEAARWKAEGWEVESDAAARAKWGNFFINRAGARRMVSIVPSETPLEAHTTVGYGSKSAE
jgi:hypothetical protein